MGGARGRLQEFRPHWSNFSMVIAETYPMCHC